MTDIKLCQFSKVVFDNGFKNKFDQYIELTVATVLGGHPHDPPPPPHNQHNCQRLVLEEPLGGRSPLRSGRLEWVIIWPRGEIITRLELGFTIVKKKYIKELLKTSTRKCGMSHYLAKR